MVTPTYSLLNFITEGVSQSFQISDSMMRELGYDGTEIMYYHFRLPNEGFDFGLRALGNDDDVRNLSRYVTHNNKMIKVYTEHGQTNLLTYFMSPTGPRRVIIEDMEKQDSIRPSSPVVAHEVVTPIQIDVGEGDLGLALTLYKSATPEFSRSKGWKHSKGASSCSRMLKLDWEGAEKTMASGEVDKGKGVEGFVDEFVVVDAEKELNKEIDVNEELDVNKSNGEGVEGFADEGYRVVMDNDPQGVNEFSTNINIDDELMTNFQPFEGFEDQDSIPFNGFEGQDNIPFNDEWRQEEPDDIEFENQNSEDEDSDFMIDEDNIIEDVDVDMEDFNLNIDTEAEFNGCQRMGGQRNEDSDEEDDLEVIDNDEWDSLSDDSGDNRKRREMIKELGKQTLCSAGEVHKVAFHIGQKYKAKKELKDKIDLHALETRRNISFTKNDKSRLTAVCDGTVVLNASGVGGPTSGKKVKGKDVNSDKVKCTWKLHASRSSEQDYWFIKTYNQKHICLQTRKIRSCTATFLSKRIMDQIEANPGLPVRALQEQLQSTYGVSISEEKAFRAKALATKNVAGDYVKQYAALRDYVLELQKTNEGTTVKIDVVSEPVVSSPTRQFRRIYVCLGPLKKGFKAGLREFLGLDGAFMKGPFPGQILSAVGVDSNNGTYPLAYVVAESENTSSWKWFLQCLAEDLDLYSNSNFTFISDRQKGLLPAIEQLFPNAEHRFCIRHIYQNMRKLFKTTEYKEYFWRCATATTIPEFEAVMVELRNYDIEAYQWLLKIPPHHWARSHFSGRAISDMLLNNLCEVFNSKLVKGRDKPIISCLEFIREYLMKRVCNVMKVLNKCQGPLTPTGTRILEANTTLASKYHARWNGGQKYQVKGPWNDQHVVDMEKRECSCRKWELTGIPCKHAIASLNEMADNNEKVGELYTYVHKVYWLDTWKEMYSFKVEPIKGRAMWPKSDCPTTLVPPPHNKAIGRPKKKRRITAEERIEIQQRKRQANSQSQNDNETQSLSRKFLTMTCSKCKQKGHNARTCKAKDGN
ncbi:unnamed protein product [Lactuca saligna]|uniref:SWIM-type domain-containing protein n=1 Tax=Lactuca saligna TaxID=75948 RepID=A0AA35VA18_LACSI|nr:unnamed protein product [Lactuca saligna]